MTATSPTWTRERVQAAGVRLQLVKGGTGEPLLILHDEMGHPGWLRFHQALAQNYTLHIPSHPGFGDSDPLDWVMNMRDLAGWYLGALQDLGLDPVKVVGFSLGGWLAAEMAAMCPRQFKKLVLVAAAGVKPPMGEIFDIFQVVAKTFITTSIIDPKGTPEFQLVCPDEPPPELVDAWETAREATCRLSWRPYMHYPALPQLLFRLRRLPTLIIWGQQDPIVPFSAGQLYHQSIPGSRLAVIQNCGHRPEVEKPEELVRLVQEFLVDG
jgi:pimeloyl-ACP methyl ester carboxylesterase